MSQTVSMSLDPEGVIDAPRNSVLAIFASLIGLVGLLGVIAPSFTVAAFTAIGLGLFVALMARRWELSSLSKTLAGLGVYLGLFGAVGGMALATRKENLLNRQAIDVAKQYIEALASGNRGEAIRLTGLPPAVEDPSVDERALSREQAGVRKFLNDPVVKAVVERGSQAKWRPTKIVSKHRTGTVLELDVGFVDESLANAKPYLVSLKLTPPAKYAADQRRVWYVDRISIDPR